MARVEIYNEHSSIVPVLFATHDPQWKPCLDNIKIKDEPVDDASNNSHLKYGDNDNESTITKCLQSTVHIDSEVITPNAIVIPQKNMDSKDLSSTYLSDASNGNNSRVSKNKSKYKPTNAKSNQNHIDVETSMGIINRRLRTRTKSKVIECDICYITFLEESILKIHKKRYAKGELTCGLCRKQFNSSAHLIDHRRSIHPDDSWNHFKFECYYCSLKFSHKRHLQQHMFHHHDMKEIFNSTESSHQIKSPQATLRKIFIDSKSQNHERIKKKRNNTMMIEPSLKKFTICRNDKINPLSEDKIDKTNQLCRDGTSVIKLKQSISNYQKKNNIMSRSVDALSNSSVQPSLVKICATPHQVQTLLNDKTSIDDAFSVDKDSTNDLNGSEYSKAPCRLSTNTYCLRSTGRLAKCSTPNRSTKRKWTTLKKRLNIKNCRVKVERLNHPALNDYKSTNHVTEFSNSKETKIMQINSTSTVGMELKNLEWALKKLQVENQSQEPVKKKDQNTPENLQQLSISTNSVSLSSHDIAIMNSSALKILYLSSLCQTRYTTKKKLIYHYLRFHTRPEYDQCAICRSHYNDIIELKEHLKEHCIEIPESSLDKSPIDPKESCKNSREKYMCKGCKKKFWLMSYLKDHESCCEVLHKLQEINLANKQQSDDEIKLDGFSESISQMQSIQSNSGGDSSLQTMRKFKKRTPKTYKCTVCYTTFKNTMKFFEHEKKYSPSIDNYHCRHCGTPFPSVLILEAHTQAAHKCKSPFKFVCVICNEGFHKKSSLRQHMLHIHNGEMKYDPSNTLPRAEHSLERTCSICKLKFPDRKSYIKHSMHYYDDNVIKCFTCDETFSSLYKALSHKKKVHNTEKMKKKQVYSCSLCNEGFIYPIDMYSHMYHIHDTAIPADKYLSMTQDIQESDQHGLLYTCQICNALFSTAALLNEHQLEYSNTGNHFCSHCSRRCKTRPLLEKHIKLTHGGPHPSGHIECKSCNEVLTSVASWNFHVKHNHPCSNLDMQVLKAPTNETYSKKCEIEKTTDNETENDNDNPHTPYPIKIEYTCALCDRQFVNSTDLKTHLLHYGYTCIHNNTEIDTNFLIDRIYSVKPEDYEKLCNTENDDINLITIDQQNNISEVIDKVSESSVIDNTIKISVNSNLNKLNPNNSCSICKRNFPTRSMLTKHERLYSNTGDHKCKYCHRKFQNIKHFQAHNRKHERRKFEKYIPSHYCKTCDEKFGSENSKMTHFAHIHNELVQLQSHANNYSAQRHSIRQQSKILHQKNLESFVTHNLNREQSKKTDEKINITEVDLSKKIIPFVNLNIDQKIELNSVSKSKPSQTTLDNIQTNLPAITENTKKASNTSSVNTLNDSMIKIVKEIPVNVGLNSKVVKVPQKETKEQKQTVVTEQGLEITVEEEEMIDVDMSTNINTSQVLCDICGIVFINKYGLVDHKKKTHGMDLNIDILNNTQEKHLNKELISSDKVQNDPPSKNYSKTNLDTSKNSCTNTDIKKCTSTQLLKFSKKYCEENQLTCKICHEAYPTLSLLINHLMKKHQINLQKKTNNIQNPCVSSSNKICSPEERMKLCHVQLCCRFCGERFVNDQYLYEHIENTHNITGGSSTKSRLLPRSNLLLNNFNKTDARNNSQNIESTHPKPSRVTIVKTTNVIKKKNNNLLLGIKPSFILKLPRNSINVSSTRCRKIPMSKLIKTIHNRPILP